MIKAAILIVLSMTAHAGVLSTRGGGSAKAFGFLSAPPVVLPTNVVAWASFGGSTFFTNDCTSDPCTIARQNTTKGNTSWLTSVTRTTTGTYVLNFASNTFSVAPTCVLMCRGGGANTLASLGATDSTTTTMPLRCYTPNQGPVIDSSVIVICKG